MGMAWAIALHVKESNDVLDNKNKTDWFTMPHSKNKISPSNACLPTLTDLGQFLWSNFPGREHFLEAPHHWCQRLLL